MSIDPRIQTASEAVASVELSDDLPARIRTWTEDRRPIGVLERELVERGARLTWALDQAEREEAALVEQRVREAARRSRLGRIEQVADLARKLFRMPARRPIKTSAPACPDDPAVFVARLEETSEGARWLLDRWREQRELLKVARTWCASDQFRFVRLLGKHPVDAVDDPELNAIFLAWNVFGAGFGSKFWEWMQSLGSPDDSPLQASRTWRAIVPPPGSQEAAIVLILKIIDDRIARYKRRVAELKEAEGKETPDPAERASFRSSPAGERLRRAHSARTRELHRTIELLIKLRAAKAEQPGIAPNESERLRSTRVRRDGDGESDRDERPRRRPRRGRSRPLPACKGAWSGRRRAARFVAYGLESADSPASVVRPSIASRPNKWRIGEGLPTTPGRRPGGPPTEPGARARAGRPARTPGRGP